MCPNNCYSQNSYFQSVLCVMTVHRITFEISDVTTLNFERYSTNNHGVKIEDIVLMTNCS